MGMLKRLTIFFIIILILAMLSIYWPKITGNTTNNQQPTTYKRESAIVTRIVDGDTIKAMVNNKEETIRLLGINTPEKGKPYSNEAKNFLNGFINESIELLRDKEDLDKYGRKLRYVFYGNRILNVEILEQGLATSFMLDELKYKDKLKTAENLARNNKLGLWKKSVDICGNCIVLQELNPKEEFFIIKNNCDFQCDLENWLVKDDANHFFYMKSMNALDNLRYDSKTDIWNDAGDRFFMRDKTGNLVIFYEY